MRSRYLILVILLSGLGLAFVLYSDSSKPVPCNAAAKLPFGFVDSPRAGDTLRGQTRFHGWALSEAGIQMVNVYLDRKFAAIATKAVSRPDVQSVFPALPESAMCGWEVGFDTTGMKPGAHEIVVQARSRDGATRDVGIVPIVVAQ
jgi:hypothetical protein